MKKVRQKEPPRFIEYANEQTAFQDKNDATLTWAWLLSCPAERGAGGSIWNKEVAWETLRAHQQHFRKLLGGIITNRLTIELMQQLTEHCNHVHVDSRYSMAPEQVRTQAAQRYQATRPALAQYLTQRLGREVTLPLRLVEPPPRYYEVWRYQDPLDALYLELRNVFRTGKIDRLKQCPECQQYFMQMTAHKGVYCSTPCRLKANPTKQVCNADYQRRYRVAKRDWQLKKDLQQVDVFKKKFKATHGVPPDISDVLDALQMSKRRWNTLCRWEEKHHGHQKVTYLMP